MIATWKNEIGDIRHLAVEATLDDAAFDHGGETLSARSTTKALSGAVAYVANRYGRDAMQRACVDLVRHQASWRTSFGKLPISHQGTAPEPIAVIAALCRGILPLAGARNLKSALSFWASEDDPSVISTVLSC